MYLPKEFVTQMQEILNDEAKEFFLALQNQTARPGLRVNTLKINVEEFTKLSPWPLESVLWCPEGFYYPKDARPAKHPYYHAGLFYLQEPSAMAPVTVLDPRPGEFVLDLCSAPGGKSLQIAARLKGEGLLVANDLYPDRLKALTRNIEQAGIKNAVILNETPEHLNRSFTNFFDKILIDAPCSGEGMFRKDQRAVRSWEDYPPVFCQRRQRGILEEAAKLLRPGGVLVYSTCTFNRQENEEVVNDFLQSNQDFEGLDLQKTSGLVNGTKPYTLRLWPHKIEGEGHFIAKIARKGLKAEKNIPKEASRELPELFLEFCEENLLLDISQYNFSAYGNHLFLTAKTLPSLDGLKVSRPGWFIGELKVKRFEPSQALIMALKKEQVVNQMSFSLQDHELYSYLRGQTIKVDKQNGWRGIFLDEFPLGWGKVSNLMLKNHYPKGWRMI